MNFFLLLGDFNAGTSETTLAEFCDTYNLKNMIRVPTCFKHPLNPSSVDVILTNRLESSKTAKQLKLDYQTITKRP